MSLINQVLKDLDQQRGPADGLQVAALQGIGLVQGKQTRWPTIVTGSVLLLALALAGFVLIKFSGNETGADAGVNVAALVATDVNTSTSPSETLEVVPETRTATVPAVAIERPEPPSSTSTTAPKEEIAEAPQLASSPPKPMKTLSVRQQAEHTFAAAQQAMNRGDNVRAERLFQEALEYYPRLADARLQLAAIFIDRNDTARTKHVLNEGLLLDPTQIRLGHLYAQLLAADNDYEQALKVLSRVSDSRSPDAETLALRAALYARLNNYEDAASSYRQALNIDRGKANWWMGFGLALEQQGLYGSARDAYLKASNLPASESVNAFVHQRLQQLGKPAGDG